MRSRRKQKITMELVLTEENEEKALEYLFKHVRELYESGRLNVKVESVGREQLLKELIADVTAHR